jgi:hypothetical protein
MRQPGYSARIVSPAIHALTDDGLVRIVPRWVPSALDL